MFPIGFKAECKTHVKYNPNFLKNYACVCICTQVYIYMKIQGKSPTKMLMGIISGQWACKGFLFPNLLLKSHWVIQRDLNVPVPFNTKILYPGEQSEIYMRIYGRKHPFENYNTENDDFIRKPTTIKKKKPN